jgi:hypothetical protein
VVKPPLKTTVMMATKLTVVKKRRRTGLTVLRTAKAKAMAPRNPENHIICKN